MTDLASDFDAVKRCFATVSADVDHYLGARTQLEETGLFGDLGIPNATTVQLLKPSLSSLTELADRVDALRKELIDEWLRTTESRRELSEIVGVSQPTLSRWQSKL